MIRERGPHKGDLEGAFRKGEGKTRKHPRGKQGKRKSREVAQNKHKFID